MKKIVRVVLLCLLSSTCFANGKYTSTDGNLVISDVNVDDQTFFDSVTLKLDLTNGTFSIIDAQAKANTTSEIALQQIETGDYSVGLLGCARTGEIIELSSGDLRVVICNIQITNNQEDGLLTIFTRFPHTFVIDNFSTDTRPEKVASSGNEDDSEIDVFQPKEQPITTSFTIWMNINATSIQSFLPSIYSAGVRLPIEFTDIDF